MSCENLFIAELLLFPILTMLYGMHYVRYRAAARQEKWDLVKLCMKLLDSRPPAYDQFSTDSSATESSKSRCIVKRSSPPSGSASDAQPSKPEVRSGDEVLPPE
jgi:hypothetical protein